MQEGRGGGAAYSFTARFDQDQDHHHCQSSVNSMTWDSIPPLHFDILLHKVPSTLITYIDDVCPAIASTPLVYFTQSLTHVKGELEPHQPSSRLVEVLRGVKGIPLPMAVVDGNRRLLAMIMGAGQHLPQPDPQVKAAVAPSSSSSYTHAPPSGLISITWLTDC